jgi:hypothetical protein
MYLVSCGFPDGVARAEAEAEGHINHLIHVDSFNSCTYSIY